MQRINDDDLSAHVLATTEEKYVHLKIEAEATDIRCSASLVRHGSSPASLATFYGKAARARPKSPG
jgi:hypothetical protein